MMTTNSLILLLNRLVMAITIFNCFVYVHGFHVPQPLPRVILIFVFLFLHEPMFNNLIWYRMQTNNTLSNIDATQPVAASADGLVGFLDGFVTALLMVLVSELGDKTFFIAGIMGMHHARLLFFAGAVLALAAMTILSGNRFFLIIFFYYNSHKLFLRVN